jgi:hypothetical protein
MGAALTHLFTSQGRTLYPSTNTAMHLLGLPGGLLRPSLKPRARDQFHGLARLAGASAERMDPDTIARAFRFMLSLPNTASVAEMPLNTRLESTL